MVAMEARVTAYLEECVAVQWSLCHDLDLALEAKLEHCFSRLAPATLNLRYQELCSFRRVSIAITLEWALVIVELQSTVEGPYLQELVEKVQRTPMPLIVTCHSITLMPSSP
jgi:hypothetical protein